MSAEDLVVVKDNQILNASYRLSLIEQRIVLGCIARVNSTEELSKNDGFTVTISELQDLTTAGKKGLTSMYTEAKKAVEVSIDDKSIKIAYHLFNRFHSPPSEVSTALKKINNLEEEDLSNDPSKYSDDGNGGDLNEVETKNIKKWRRIFYLLCIDPNNEII